MKARRARAVGLVLLAWSGAAAVVAQQRAGFDHYVLALSWSPTWCAARERTEPFQCGPGRRYDFIVHGLWPQRRNGWPEYCSGTRISLPPSLIEDMLDIMPSPALVRHQWTKHGTCTGLAPEDYFALTRRLHDEITIPARYVEPAGSIEVSVKQFVADFLATNSRLSRDMIEVHCGNRRGTARLAELRICFSRDGTLRACGANGRPQCRADRLILPPVR